jgi:hypothetical protein
LWQPAQRRVHGCGNLHRGVCTLPLPYNSAVLRRRCGLRAGDQALLAASPGQQLGASLESRRHLDLLPVTWISCRSL